MSDDNLKPGEKAPKSGQYEVIGSDGEDQQREITSVKGNPLPPAPEAGKLIDI